MIDFIRPFDKWRRAVDEKWFVVAHGDLRASLQRGPPLNSEEEVDAEIKRLHAELTRQIIEQEGEASEERAAGGKRRLDADMQIAHMQHEREERQTEARAAALKRIEDRERRNRSPWSWDGV
jgi:hypothetical protein